MMKNPTERFTDTVEDYVKFRPSYPKEIIDFLVHTCHLNKNHIIADIGSGTGFLTKLFLDFGNITYGVEPNNGMRAAGEKYLIDYPNFHSINGTAEATTLENQSVDFISAGTAFHWFNVENSKTEFKRILKSSGWIVLVWNVRDRAHSPLQEDYEHLLLKYAKDYTQTAAIRFDETIGSDFFYPNEMKITEFKNVQCFDWNGLQGRLLSTSYALRSNEPGYDEMINDLKKLFEKYKKNERIEFLYKTKLYYGRL